MTAIGKNKFLQFPVFLLSAVLNDAKIIECNNSNVTQGELRTNKKLQEEVQSTKYTVLVRTYYVLCYDTNKYYTDLDNICIHNIDQVLSTIGKLCDAMIT